LLTKQAHVQRCLLRTHLDVLLCCRHHLPHSACSNEALRGGLGCIGAGVCAAEGCAPGVCCLRHIQQQAAGAAGGSASKQGRHRSDIDNAAAAGHVNRHR
jgi:hypothetical protein